MRFVLALAALLLMTPHGALAQQAVTAGQLMANGFEVRASYMVEKGTPVLVFAKRRRRLSVFAAARRPVAQIFAGPHRPGRQADAAPADGLRATEIKQT
jgi:hypothetical protein